jgi:hypothetical protein
MPPLPLPWDPAVTRRALLLALAAWLSFAIATLLHVHNAYWAAMPVWVISQPARGVLLERAVFRVVGTLLGAAVGFAIILLPGPPLLQAAALALWIGLNAGTTHVLRGVHSYGAFMAGITSAVVVIPSLLAPAGFEAIAAHLGRDWHRPLPAEARQLPALDDSGLVRLDRALGEILAADQTLAVPTGLPPEPGTGWLAPHREWKLAWSSGLLATGASFAAAALALRLRVPAMGLAALGVCVFTMVLGGMALPQRVAPKLFAGCCLACWSRWATGCWCSRPSPATWACCSASPRSCSPGASPWPIPAPRRWAWTPACAS